MAFQFSAIHNHVSNNNNNDDNKIHNNATLGLGDPRAIFVNRNVGGKKTVYDSATKKAATINNQIAAQVKPDATKQQIPSTTAPAPTSLKKPVPAVMCTSHPQCKVQACSSTSSTPQQQQQQQQPLPDFLRPFPDPHYGYGFVDRGKNRGVRMTIGGSAASGSGCALSHKYQFIFVHVLKSGGTTVKGFLQDGLCGNTQLPCATGNDNLQIVDCASSIAKYPNYFVFSFVRNPYSRMYSAYAMAHSYRYHPTKPKAPFSFEAFTTGRDANSTSQATVVTAKFQKVLNHNRNKMRTVLSYLHPSHYFPQTHFLFSSKNGVICPAVDFLGHLETMKEDLHSILTYIQSPELWKHYEKRMNPPVTNNNTTKAAKGFLKNDNSTAFGDAKKKTDLGGNLQTAYQIIQQSSSSSSSQSEWTAIQKAVAEEYKLDFSLLGYDPNVVPK